MRALVLIAVSLSLGAHVSAAAKRSGFSGEVAVARDGKIVYAQGFGAANRATGARPALDTSFNLASIGKTFTGVAMAQLVAHGEVSFSDRVGRYLPQLPAPMRAITVGELLDHTSGLGDFFNDPAYFRLQPKLTSLAAYLPLIESEHLQFAPGSHWSYSNSGFLLAGLVIEKASGESYYDYVREHIWAKAGMTHTGCYSRTRLPSFAAVGYSGGAPNTSALPPRGTSAGGCYSSARDLIRFANALEHGRLVRRSLVREITTSKVPAPGGSYGYGFGIRDGTVWHNGGAPGAGGELDIDVAKGIVVVTLGNTDPPHVVPVVDATLNTLRVP